MIFGAAARFLKSLRLTIFLIICLAAVFLLGVVVPQKSLLGREMYLAWKLNKPALVSFLEAIGATGIYRSPVTLALWGLFFLNLIFVMAGRIPSVIARCKSTEPPRDANALKGERNYEIIESGSVEAAAEALTARGYRFFGQGENKNSFRAVKNRFSPLATILFHLSFFLLLFGGVASFYTKFRAEAHLAVGEAFTGRYETFTPPKLGDIPRTVFTVEDIKPVYYKKNWPVDLKVTLITKKGRRVIGINNPYKEGPLSFVIKNIDVAPLFVLRDEGGREVDGAYVKLKVLSGEEDRFHMAGHDFNAVFYADLGQKADEAKETGSSLPQALKQSPIPDDGPQGREVVNPGFRIAVSREGRLLAEKTIGLGERVDFGRYSLSFERVTYWAKFLVVKEYGPGVIYAGFVLMIAALIVRFVFYRRDVRGIVDKEGRLHMSGRAEYFPSLFAEELKALFVALKAGGR